VVSHQIKFCVAVEEVGEEVVVDVVETPVDVDVVFDDVVEDLVASKWSWLKRRLTTMCRTKVLYSAFSWRHVVI